MPRVKLYKKKYTEDDLYLFINVQMKIKGINQTDIGTVLGDTQQNVSRKLRRHLLSTHDLISLFDYFQTDAETAGRLMTGTWKG